MTHEFKTPISTIGISANVLSEPEIANDPNRLANYASIISDQNRRLENQIEKVLQVARIEKNKLNLKLEEIDLHKMIQRIAESFKLNIEDLDGELILELNAGSFKVMADKQHLNNVIYNLVDNALKYKKDKPKVIVRTSIANDFIELEVKDNGIGIDKKYINKIFDKFFRVPAGNVHNVKGFGIGLNYVKNIMDAHKWKIEIQSIIGEGSTFKLIIPVLNN